MTELNPLCLLLFHSISFVTVLILHSGHNIDDRPCECDLVNRVMCVAPEWYDLVCS